MQPLRPNGERARIAKLMIQIVLAADIATLLVDLYNYKLLLGLKAGDAIDEATTSFYELLGSGVAIVYFLVFVISGITFLLWFRRAYFNLHQRVNHLAVGEGWAVGSWFVPIINLSRPYKIMRELYVETKELLDKHGISLPVPLKPGFVGMWWALWLFANFMSYIILAMSKNATTLTGFINAAEGSLFVTAVNIALALVAVKVVGDYARVEAVLPEVRAEVDRT